MERPQFDYRIHIIDRLGTGERIMILMMIKLIGAVFLLAIQPSSGYAIAPGQLFDEVKDAIVVVMTLDTYGPRKE